ncbi:MAG: hypothetical protein GF409_01615 [Candidatus Omnitrophica bacterium]|nr:hypothetical protein [Candidatus Omnitrophota bacterium]
MVLRSNTNVKGAIMKSAKLLVIWSLTVLVSMCACTQSFAQRSPAKAPKKILETHEEISRIWSKGDFESRFFERIGIILNNKKKLSLRDSQVQQITELRNNAKNALKPLNKKISTLDVQINTMSWEEFDLDAINELIAQKHQLMRKKELEMVSAHDELLQILNREQVKALDSMPEGPQGVVDPGHEELTYEEPAL